MLKRRRGKTQHLSERVMFRLRDGTTKIAKAIVHEEVADLL